MQGIKAKFMANPVYVTTKVVGVFQLVAGILAAVAMVFLFTFGVYPQEKTVLYYEMVCATACTAGMFLGIESIFFLSKKTRGLRNGFKFAILLSLFVGIILGYMSGNFKKVYLGDIILKSPKDYWDKRVLKTYQQSYLLGRTSCYLLFLTIIPLLYLLYEKTEHKKT